MINSTSLIALDCFIESHSQVIRGLKVISDIDLANLFEIKLYYLYKKIDANIIRFPDDFMLVLTHPEKQKYRCKRYAFTESGLFMLSGLLKSKRAIRISIDLIYLLVDKQPGLIYKLL
jgi:hypothetical protein